MYVAAYGGRNSIFQEPINTWRSWYLDVQYSSTMIAVRELLRVYIYPWVYWTCVEMEMMAVVPRMNGRHVMLRSSLITEAINEPNQRCHMQGCSFHTTTRAQAAAAVRNSLHLQGG